MTECLSHLLFPLDADSFLKHYQAKRHFHVARASPGYYADLVSISELDAVLQSRHLPAVSLNVVSDGVPYPIEEWTCIKKGARDAHRVAVPERLLRLYTSGATLILNQAHEALQALNGTCRTLTEELGFPTQANIYITPRGSSGFSKHSDEHDVLVLQIAGSKCWHVYPPDGPAVEIDLQSGDLLYVPRRMFHAATCREEDSIHITLGLLPVYAFQLFRDLEALACGMENFQRPLPPRFAGAGAMQAFETDFVAGLQILLAGMKPCQLTNRRRDHLVTTQLEGWPGRLSDLRILHLITRNTVVCKRRGILTAVKEYGKFLNIEFADKRIAIPVFMRHELPRILGDCNFTVDEIGGMITLSGKVKLITEFVKEGLLRIIDI